MNDALQQILKIDLVQYAHSLGYTEKIRAKSSVRWTVLKNPATHDQIRIKASDPMMYSNNDPGLDQDRGNVINFCINRLEGSIVPSFKPEKAQYAKAFKTLKSYIGQVTPEAVFHEVKDYSKKVLDKNKIKNLRPFTGITSMYLLEKRNIDPNILHNPLFKNMIMEAPVPMANGKVIFNTAFAKTDIDENITGYVSHFYSSKEKKNLKRVFELRPTLFKSSFVGKPNTLFLCETAVDAISHYEMHRPKDIMYASFGGQVIQDEINEIQLLLQKMENNSTIVSITDNDYSGTQYDLKIAVELYNIKHPENHIEYLQLSSSNKIVIHDENDIDIDVLKKNMMAIFNEEMDQNIDKHLLPYFNFAKTKSMTVIEFPRSKERKHHLFLQPLIRSVHKINGQNFQFNKSNLKDWNDELKLSKKKIVPELKTNIPQQPQQRIRRQL